MKSKTWDEERKKKEERKTEKGIPTNCLETQFFSC
jgi:hypothetical protein